MTTSSIDSAVTSAAADQLPLTMTEAARALRSGTITSVELTQKTIARAEALDGVLGVYIVRTDEQALAAAAAADADFASGIDRGPMQGIPLGVKDIISTAGAPTTAQSLILDPKFGSQGDARVVARLKAAGAVITGKTTTMEYAVGMPDADKPFPVPHNPFSLSHWPGGSSSGTGGGVAAGLFLGGLGTDTGGSIRIPAAWCGISGMKPTFGRVPKSGVVPLGFSLDNVGPMTRSARDCATMLSVLAGLDESDASSVDVPVDDYASALTGAIEGLRIGVDLSYFESPLCNADNTAAMHAAIAVFTQAGAIVVDAPLPYRDELKATAMMGLAAEAFAYHRKDLQTRWSEYGAETRMSIGSAGLFSAADFVQIQRVRRAGAKAMTSLFADIDVHLTPTALTGALRLGEDFGSLIDVVNTPYWNSVGYPAMSIPMGQTSEGLPVGLQLAGRPFEESTVLRAADAYQLHTDHHLAESTTVLEMLK